MHGVQISVYKTLNKTTNVSTFTVIKQNCGFLLDKALLNELEVAIWLDDTWYDG